MKVQQKNTTTTWKVLYGITYGGVVAGAYLFAKIRGQGGGLALFGAGAAIVFLLHLLVWPSRTARGLGDRKMLLRGLLYGLTQVLIFKAQSHGHTSAALVASTMGSVFGVILGRAFLRERIEGLAVLAACCCFAAVFVNPLLVLRSYWGIFGGFLQGSGFVLARALMVENRSARQSISTGFFVAALVSGVALLASGQLGSVLTVGRSNLLMVVVIALVVQYAFFHLYKILDAQRASMLLLSRIPWAITAEHFVLGTAMAIQSVASGLLISLGSILLLLDARLQRTHQQATPMMRQHQ